MFARLVGLGLLLAVALSPTTVFAAKLLSLELEQDGSNDPAGDVLHLRILFEKEDGEIAVGVRGYAVRGEFQEEQTQAFGNGLDPSDPKAYFIVLEKIAKPEIADTVAVVEKRLVVPYASLNLEAGKETKLGYSVWGFDTAKGDVSFVAPTELTTIKFTPDKERKERSVLIPGGPEVVAGEVDAYVLNGEEAVVKGTVIGLKPTGKMVEEHVETVPLKKPVTGGYERGVKKERASATPTPMADGRAAIASAMKEGPQPRNWIYYATNRRGRTVEGETIYEAANGKALSYGKCVVYIPSRKEEQAWWSRKYAKVLWVMSSGKEGFYEELAEGSEDDVLLFTHGYANTFESAILQAGRLKRDLEFKGKTVAFSWPSAGRVDSYGFDETQAEEAIPYFADFLQELLVRAKEKGSKVYMLAHSMGNRVFMHGLRRVEKRMGKHFPVGVLQLAVMAAPDVDLNLFGSLVPSVVKNSDMVSFYYSTFDRALQASNLIHGQKRAGLTPFFNDGLDTINVDNVNSSWVSFAHSYYTESEPVVYDLYLTTKYHYRPKRRSPPILLDLATQAKLQFDHWFFKKP